MLFRFLGSLAGLTAGTVLGTAAGAVAYGADRLSGIDHDEAGENFTRVTERVFKVTYKTGRAAGAVGDLALTVVTMGAVPPPSVNDFDITSD
ncbi:hypothetical protein ABZ402_00300 [Streptomyces mirabilis]|uniref:hypothetical protein n=1 Tax=Streptomyces mirabilis TaxID=68239 RepID=UPI0034100A08